MRKMPEKSDQFISFVVIAFNEAHKIRSCLEAVSSQQGLEHHEIIVVNDGSTDATAEVVEEFAIGRETITLINQENRGRGAARAAGTAIAKGSLICMVDADICLPPNWLSKCMPYLAEYDAVGGTAVPDGDVAYLCDRFNLDPLPIHSPIAVAGSNGLFRSEVFHVIGFDVNLREGEDVAFNHELAQHGFRAYCVPGLLAVHRGSKSFLPSLRWLFQSGRGATRQFARYREIRVPDLAYAGFMSGILISLLGVLPRRVVKPLLASYILIVSGQHVRGKFNFERRPSYASRYIAAIFVNALFIGSYFAGRTVGLSDWMRSFPSNPIVDTSGDTEPPTSSRH